VTYLKSAAPPTTLGFGVVCKADWLFDIGIRSTSTTLRRYQLPEKAARRQFGRPDVDYLVAEPHAATEKERAVLGFGTAWPAYIVLTDDCALEKCRGRGKWAPTDLVTLAPLRPRVREEPEDLALLTTLNRFPLPRDDQYDQDQVALLSQTFQVDSRHIWTNAGELRPGLELLRQLDAITKDGLLQRWAAHTARQGPLVGADNAEKLAQLLTDLLEVGGQADDVADCLTRLADRTWEYENGPLEAISSLWESWTKTSQAPDVDALIHNLKAALSRLQSASQQVIDALQAVRPEVAADTPPPSNEVGHSGNE
jgi:hypothetical protein